jgi:hypothetical protein
MKKIIHIFLFACVALVTSCKEDKPLMYEEDPRVYLLNRFTVGSNDSINYSFAFQGEEVQSYSMNLYFRIIGFPKDYDRSIAIAIDGDATAQEGVHYSIENLYIPANASDGMAVLTFYRQPDLKENTVGAVLRIIENEYFKPGYQNLEYGRLDRLSYKFSLTDKLSKPEIWDSYWQSRFGDYSERKIVFLTQALPYSNWNSGAISPRFKSTYTKGPDSTLRIRKSEWPDDR